MTDPARECAQEIANEIDKLRQEYGAVSFHGNCFEKIIAKHFPPSVPVSKLEEVISKYSQVHLDCDGFQDGECVNLDDIQALIAEAK